MSVTKIKIQPTCLYIQDSKGNWVYYGETRTEKEAQEWAADMAINRGKRVRIISGYVGPVASAI